MNDRNDKNKDVAPVWARVRWFADNYGLTRYMLVGMAKEHGCGCVRLSEGHAAGVLLFRVADVVKVLEEKAATCSWEATRPPTRGKNAVRATPAPHPRKRLCRMARETSNGAVAEGAGRG